LEAEPGGAIVENEGLNWLRASSPGEMATALAVAVLVALTVCTRETGEEASETGTWSREGRARSDAMSEAWPGVMCMCGVVGLKAVE
jgi:hypothetical protein